MLLWNVFYLLLRPFRTNISRNIDQIFDTGLYPTYEYFDEYSPNMRARRLVDAVVKKKSEMNEGKHERFRTLAESRTNKAIEAISRIGNLSNRQIYDYDDAEVKKIVRALRDAVAMVESRFQSPRGKTGGGFKLLGADSGPSRTPIPAHCGQRSGDCGQFLMSV